MNEDRIKSLCISVLNNSGQPRLFRIADLIDDALIPYSVDYSTARGGINTDQIFHPDVSIPPEGTINLWEWYSPDDMRQFSYKLTEKIFWIEYVKLPNVTSLEELKLVFHDGIDFEFSPEHNYLIEFFVISENAYKCVFCGCGDFVLKNNKYVLRDNIYHLNCFEISKQEIFEIKTHLLPKMNKWFYANLYLPERVSSILVKTPAGTVSKAILKRIQRCTEGFSKADKKVISDFVRSLSSEKIINQVAIECQCTDEESREYITEFIKLCDNYFIEEDITDVILTRLIESNSNIADKFQTLIQQKWKSENADQIENTNKEKQHLQEELSLLQKQIDTLVNECEEYEEIKKQTEIKITEVEDSYAQKIALADDITAKVQSRIIDAKNDLSSFFSEYAMFSGKSTEIYNNINEKDTVYYGRTLEAEPEQLSETNEVIDSLKENLEAVGIGKTVSSSLAAYLLAAYYMETPLIVTGYGSDYIIDAVSATLFNKMADILYLPPEGAKISIENSPIVAIHNGFKYVNRILRSSSDTYPYFVCQTSEELLLEPRSIYNYALPLFAEYFFTENKVENLYGTFSTLEKIILEKAYRIALPEYIVPPLAYRNLSNIVAYANKLYDGLSEINVHLLTTLPVMCSLGKNNDLCEVISSLNLSDKEKLKLFTYIGEKR